MRGRSCQLFWRPRKGTQSEAWRSACTWDVILPSRPRHGGRPGMTPRRSGLRCNSRSLWHCQPQCQARNFTSITYSPLQAGLAQLEASVWRRNTVSADRLTNTTAWLYKRKLPIAARTNTLARAGEGASGVTLLLISLCFCSGVPRRMAGAATQVDFFRAPQARQSTAIANAGTVRSRELPDRQALTASGRKAPLCNYSFPAERLLLPTAEHAVHVTLG